VFVGAVPRGSRPSSLKMLTRSRYDLPDDAAQPDQIAYGFMIGVRHPDGRQLSSPMKTGEHGRVATICFHPIAAFVGISDGATTSHRWPRRVSWR
jgi:hypothetical protein